MKTNKKRKYVSIKTFATTTILWEKDYIFWQNCKGADILAMTVNVSFHFILDVIYIILL